MLVQCQPALQEPLGCQRVDPVFLFNHPRGQSCSVVSGQYRHLCLHNGGAAIQLCGDEVHGGARLRVSGIQGTLVGVQPRVLGQQGGVNVQQAAKKGFSKYRREDAHEAGEDDQVGLPRGKAFHQRGVESLAAGVVAVLDAGGWQARIPGTFQPRGIGPVAEHQADLGVQATVCTGIHEGLQVGAAPGYQYGNAAALPVRHARSSTPRSPATISPRRQACRPSVASRA